MFGNGAHGEVVRHPIPNSSFPIAQSVQVGGNATTYYVSGQVPPVLNKDADPSAVAAYGDTKTQTVGVLSRIKGILEGLGLSMNLPSMFETLMKLKEEGRTRAIGVANFNIALLKTVVEELRAPIACNQIEYHVMLDQSKVKKYMDSKSIPLVAYCPLAQGRAASDPTLMAIGNKHNATAAQVALRWLLDQDGVAAIPKASRHESQKANWDALGVKLDDDDRRKIAALPKDKRFVSPGFSPAWD